MNINEDGCLIQNEDIRPNNDENRRTNINEDDCLIKRRIFARKLMRIDA